MRIIIPTAVFWITLSLALMAYKDGPLPDMTGGFGEPSCHSCHLDNPLNTPGGSLSVAGVPSSYAPGQTYRITISLARQGMQRGGFQMSARFASGEQKGKAAGSWRLLDQRVQMIPSQVEPWLQFVQHTAAGTVTPTPGAIRWTIEWIAPPVAAGPVQFNAAGNASNDDASPLGDDIYLKALRSVP